MNDQEFDALIDYLERNPEKVHRLASLVGFFYWAEAYRGKVSVVLPVEHNLKEWPYARSEGDISAQGDET